jgi:hypothetical protein
MFIFGYLFEETVGGFFFIKIYLYSCKLEEYKESLGDALRDINIVNI